MKQKIIIITPVPEMIQSFLSHTMARKAIELDIVDLQIFNLRDYSNGKYRQIDDTPSVSYTHLTLPTICSV